MKQPTYHAIILDLGFKNPDIIEENFKIFAKRKSKTNPWVLYGIEINPQNLQETIEYIQYNLKEDEPYYNHFYNDEELIVVFKDKVINVKPHKSTWKPIIEYGRTLNIPEEQLDFWPNRFQDEIHYFEPGDFV